MGNIIPKILGLDVLLEFFSFIVYKFRNGYY